MKICGKDINREQEIILGQLLKNQGGYYCHYSPDAIYGLIHDDVIYTQSLIEWRAGHGS